MRRLTVTRAQPSTSNRATLEARLDDYVGKYNKTIVQNKKLLTANKNLRDTNQKCLDEIDNLNDKLREFEQQKEEEITKRVEALENGIYEKADERNAELEAQVDHLNDELESALTAARTGDLTAVIRHLMEAFAEPKWTSSQDCQKAYDAWVNERDRLRAIEAAPLLQTKIVIEAPKYGARIKRRS